MLSKSGPTTYISTSEGNSHSHSELIQEVNTLIYHCPINSNPIEWIDDYLFPDALNDNSSITFTILLPTPTESLRLPQAVVVEAQTPFCSISKSTSTSKTSNKSIFHNFQKHLKTLLKKVITLRKIDFLVLPAGSAAYDLWRIFLRQHNSSKRILYIIFGVEQQENLTCLTEAAEEIPQIEKMLARFAISEIQTAQKLLRQVVTDQILLTPKEVLKSLGKITRFDEFYIYFKVFMDELREGGISRRITKVRKTRFMNGSAPATQ